MWGEMGRQHGGPARVWERKGSVLGKNARKMHAPTSHPRAGRLRSGPHPVLPHGWFSSLTLVICGVGQGARKGERAGDGSR